MTRSAYALLIAASLAACSSQTPTGVDVKDPGKTPITSAPTTHPDHTSIPGLPVSGMPLLATGDFTLSTTTTPGTATFTQAVEVKPDDATLPASSGTGSFSVSVDGTSYDIAAANSLYTIVADDSGVEYFLIGAFQLDETTRTARVIYVMMKKSDYAPGATIALDGTDRIAMFGAGSIDADAPDVTAIATSGSFTFGGGNPLAGGLVDGTLSADFAKATFTDPSGPGGPGGPTGTGTPPAAGSYTLSFGAPQGVQCTGGFSGQEAAFAALTAADLGFNDSTVTVAGDATQVTISGAGLAAGFAGSMLTLSYAQDGNMYFSSFNFAAPQAGPLGSHRAASLLGMDTSDMSGFAGAQFLGATDADTCIVGFAVSYLP